MAKPAKVTVGNTVERAPGGVRFVLVGDYQIVTGNLGPGRVWIRHREGEAMEAPEAELAAAIGAFFKAKF